MECDCDGKIKFFGVFDICVTAFEIFNWMRLELSLDFNPQFKDLYLPLEDFEKQSSGKSSIVVRPMLANNFKPDLYQKQSRSFSYKRP